MFYVLLESSGWALFAGRFHPLFVHLPIGFLLVAALLEFGRRTGKVQVAASVITFILLWSAVGATLACAAGYLLSLGGGYDAGLLLRHQWQGIGVAVFAWVAWFVSLDKIKNKIALSPGLYTGALGISVLLTMTAGHDGGSLTHGEGYLTQHLPDPFRTLAGMPPPAQPTAQEVAVIGNVDDAVVYKDIVRPIMQARCVQCHNAGKRKGDLRLDEMAFMLKGGKGGPALVAGNVAGSDLVKRCMLGENDDMHMPPKGKPQLTTDQIALLSWWIEQGAPADKKVSQLQKSEAVKPALASLSSGGSSGDEAAKTSPVFSIVVEPGDEKKIADLKRAGLLVQPVSQASNLLEISAVNAKAFNDHQASLLPGLAEQIVSLKLAGSKVTDASLREIAKLKHLTRLHLDHTDVSDAGLAHLKSLAHLEYVNLIGTKVTDNGLKAVASMKSMRSLYVWKSHVTDSMARQLEIANPRIQINNGISEVAVAQFLQIRKDSIVKF